MPMHSRPQAQQTPGNVTVTYESIPEQRRDPSDEERRERRGRSERDMEPSMRSHTDVAIGSLDGRPWYRSEAWLAVALSAFIPVVVAVFVPQSLKLPLVGLGGVLVLAGLGLFAIRGRQTHARTGP